MRSIQPWKVLPYGQEQTVDGRDPFSVPCHVCGAEPGGLHAATCPLGPLMPHERPRRCRDCAVPIGQQHKPGCCVAVCARCGRQALLHACPMLA